MGLDGVELIMAVEEHFEIAVPDEVAGTLRTPGTIKAFVAGQTRTGDRAECLSQRAFYRLRRAVQEVDGSAACSIRPDTLWVDVLSGENRRQRWQALAEAAGLPLPTLVRPGWVSLTVVLGAGFCSVAVFAALGDAASPVVYSALCFLLISVAGVSLTRPLATRFRYECATVGAVASLAARGGPARLMHENEGWSTREISDAIDEIIEEQLGIPRTEFTDESDFVRDLGVD